MAEKKLKIVYVGDAAGVQRTVGQINRAHAGLAQHVQRVSKGFVKAGRTLSMGLTLPLAAFGKIAIDEFSEVRQVTGQTEAAIKSTGGAANVTAKHVQALAARMGKLAAVDAEQVQAAQNVILTFTKIRNEVGKGNNVFDQATLATANLSARMGTDLNSAALIVGKALNDPIKGVTSLSRAGVQFTEQQREQIKILVKSGRALDAQKLILGELETQFGGSAKAAGAAASPFHKLTLQVRDMAESAGEILLPIMGNVVGIFGGLARRFQDLSPGARGTIVKFGTIAAVAGPVLMAVGKIAGAMGSLIKGIGGAVEAMAGLVKGIVGSGGLIQGFKNVAFTLGVVGAAIGLVTLGLKVNADTARDNALAIDAVALAIFQGERTAKSFRDEINRAGVPPYAKKRFHEMLDESIDKSRDFEETQRDVNRQIRTAEDAVARYIANLRLLYSGMGGYRFRAPGSVPVKFQHGTTSAPGGWALFGETGPEIGYVPRGTRIWPSGQSRRMLERGGPGGPGGVYIYVAGSVITERDLVRSVREGLLKEARRRDLGLA